MKFHKKSGFTLVELLVYTAIFAIASGLMIGIMTTMLRVNQRESASAEATSQLNFVMQTIQRLTRESSAIIVNSSSTNVDTDDTIASQQTRLVLRMKDSKDPNDTSPDPNERDPIIIYAENNVIKMSEGKGAYKRISDLTNSRVLADNLKFTKHTQYPGHDTVSIDIQLTYNSQNPDSKVSRALQTAIARVSAATFDSSILPGSTSYEIGQQGSPWSRTYLNDGTALNPSYTFGNDTSLGIFKVSGTSTIGFSTQGLERMRIDASGNVGIGTTAPFEKLVVSGNAYLGQGQNDSILRLGGSDYEWQLRKDWADSGKFKIKYLQGNLDALTIDRNGNVGIGTTTPAGYLHISAPGGVCAGFSCPLLRLRDETVTGTYWDIYGSDGGGAPVSQFRISQTTSGSTENWRFVIDNTGNVGIGTTNPNVELHLKQASAGTLPLIDSNVGLLLENGSNNFLQFMSPSSTVQGILFGDLENTSIGRILYDHSTNAMSFYGPAGDGEQVRIDSLGNLIVKTGNVGIGTTAPGYKLQVGASGDGTSAIANAWNVFSDIRLKTNITPLTDILPKLDNISAVGFNWKNGADAKHQIGFIAQEVEKVFPELVFTDDKGYKSIDYSKFSAILLGAVKEQQKQIEELKTENNFLKFRLEKLENGK